MIFRDCCSDVSDRARSRARQARPLATAGGYGGGTLSIDFGIWDVHLAVDRALASGCSSSSRALGRAIYCRWIMSCVHVPGRPNLAFTGQPATLFWYFAAVALLIVVAHDRIGHLEQLDRSSCSALYWLVISWIVANIASNGQPLGLASPARCWSYIGWYMLAVLSFFTIIGWAWVYHGLDAMDLPQHRGHAARDRFQCDRTGIAVANARAFIACVFMIPIPWVMRWFVRW